MRQLVWIQNTSIVGYKEWHKLAFGVKKMNEWEFLTDIQSFANKDHGSF